jgi:hypothetical protein
LFTLAISIEIYNLDRTFIRVDANYLYALSPDSSSAIASQTVSAMFLSVAAGKTLGAFARLAARPRVRLLIASGGRSLRMPPFFFGCSHLRIRALSGVANSVSPSTPVLQ